MNNLNNFFILLLILSCVILLSACSKKETPPSPTEKATQAETAAIDNTQTTATTEKTSDSHSQPAEPSLNTDILSDLELTYSQLVQKYGEPINAARSRGGSFWFAFEDNSATYFWSGDDSTDWDGMVEWSGDFETFPKPKKDAKCINIMIDSPVLFRGITLPATVLELEEKYKITHIESDLNMHDGTMDSCFSYEDKIIRVSMLNTIWRMDYNEIVNRVDTVQELLESVDEFPRLNKIEVFDKNGTQIFQGELKDSMGIKISYGVGNMIEFLYSLPQEEMYIEESTNIMLAELTPFVFEGDVSVSIYKE